MRLADAERRTSNEPRLAPSAPRSLTGTGRWSRHEQDRTTTAHTPARIVQAHAFWRCHRLLYRLSRGRFLWAPASKAGGERCTSPPSGGSPAESAT